MASIFVDYSLIDSIIDSSFAYAADTSRDLLNKTVSKVFCSSFISVVQTV